MAKRKRADVATASVEIAGNLPPPLTNGTSPKLTNAALNPGHHSGVHDGQDALRASPDSDVNDDVLPVRLSEQEDGSSSELSEPPEVTKPPPKKRQAKAKKEPEVKTEDKVEFAIEAMVKKAAGAPKASKGGDELRDDPDAEGDIDADPEEIKQALSRPPPVNSDYLPLPWKGRLGYACLNTYLRNSNPPVFQSRTTRIASILEHRHPLKDPTQPEHPTKNRPDKQQPADIARGQKYVEQICLANCKDMIKMLRWNDRYNIKFLRLSSEAFPFASHAEYGYTLAPFASEALAEVGKVVAELGHRVSTHPGQFTQLGSPRNEVIKASIRDLEYHDEMLSLLKLPEQQDRDAVMVLHMGGIFGDKAATLDRFRENYAKLSGSIKRRLVLENDDMCWGVHDLLPICQELNIPMVLDFHHHNIIFDETKIREGSKDIMDLFPAIRETWTKKGITQKMHHSEPTPAAITGKQRRKHNPRPASLPPCPPDMDLMIEAKDKEQAVFELMKTFKLPGFNTFNDIIPHVRNDDNKPIRPVRAKKATTKKKKGKQEDDDDEEAADEEVEAGPALIPEEDVGMGGPEGRVYWPPGMEEWLRPVKRVVQKKDPTDAASVTTTPAKKGKAAAAAAAAAAADTPASVIKTEDETSLVDGESQFVNGNGSAASSSTKKPRKGKTANSTTPAKAKTPAKRRKTQEPSEDEMSDVPTTPLDDVDSKAYVAPQKPSVATKGKAGAGRKSGRKAGQVVNYKEEGGESE